MDERNFGNSDFFVFKRPGRSFLKRLKAIFASKESGAFLENSGDFIVCGEHGREIMSGKVDEMPVAHRIVFSAAFVAGSALVPVLGKIGFWIIVLSVFYYFVALKKRNISFGYGGETFFRVASQSRVVLKERYVLTDAAGESFGTVWWKWSLKDPAGFWRCLDKEGRDVFEMRASTSRTGSRFSLFRCADGAVAGKVSLSKQDILLRLKAGNHEDPRLVLGMIAVAFRTF